jgi:hypothetical protein
MNGTPNQKMLHPHLHRFLKFHKFRAGKGKS